MEGRQQTPGASSASVGRDSGRGRTDSSSSRSALDLGDRGAPSPGLTCEMSHRSCSSGANGVSCSTAGGAACGRTLSASIAPSAGTRAPNGAVSSPAAAPVEESATGLQRCSKRRRVGSPESALSVPRSVPTASAHTTDQLSCDRKPGVVREAAPTRQGGGGLGRRVRPRGTPRLGRPARVRVDSTGSIRSPRHGRTVSMDAPDASLTSPRARGASATPTPPVTPADRGMAVMTSPPPLRGVKRARADSEQSMTCGTITQAGSGGVGDSACAHTSAGAAAVVREPSATASCGTNTATDAGAGTIGGGREFHAGWAGSLVLRPPLRSLHASTTRSVRRSSIGSGVEGTVGRVPLPVLDAAETAAALAAAIHAAVWMSTPAGAHSGGGTDSDGAGGAAKPGAAVAALRKPQETTTKKKKKKARCPVCRAKLRSFGFSCRCGGEFCAQHRYAESHECSFDYATPHRQQLKQENPMVRAPKVTKIV